MKKLIEVVAAIIIKDNKILITRRKKGEKLEGLWEFPGGKIEKGESQEVALKREIKEELELDIQVKKYFSENIHDYGSFQVKLISYICEYIKGEINLNVHDKIMWVTKEELSQYEFSPADVPFIKELCRSN